MTKKEKIKYLRIGLNLQHININDETSDRVIETYEKILKLKGNFSIKDAVELEVLMDEKYAKKKLTNE